MPFPLRSGIWSGTSPARRAARRWRWQPGYAPRQPCRWHPPVAAVV